MYNYRRHLRPPTDRDPFKALQKVQLLTRMAAERRPRADARGPHQAAEQAWQDAGRAAGEQLRRQAASDPAAAWREQGRWKPDEIERRSANAMHNFDMLVASGVAPERAAAWAANAEGESGSGQNMEQMEGGRGRGMFQLDPSRRANFPRAFGRSLEQSTIQDQFAFPEWEFAHDPYEIEYSAPRVRKAEATNDAGMIAETIARYYLRPAERARDAADRANIANDIMRRWRSRGNTPQRFIGPERR